MGIYNDMTFPITRKEVQGSNDEEVTRKNGTKQATGGVNRHRNSITGSKTSQASSYSSC